MKTLNLNGQKVKVDAEFLVGEVIAGKYQVTVVINGKRYSNAFTGTCNISATTGRYSVTFVCNTTGAKFGDSEKKCMEHLLNNNL